MGVPLLIGSVLEKYCITGTITKVVEGKEQFISQYNYTIPMLIFACFGFIGILLAAPTLASLKLLSTYILRKLMDMDPWVGLSMFPPAEPWSAVFGRIKDRLAKIFRIKPKAKASVQLSEQTKNTKTNNNPS